MCIHFIKVLSRGEQGSYGFFEFAVFMYIPTDCVASLFLERKHDI